MKRKRKSKSKIHQPSTQTSSASALAFITHLHSFLVQSCLHKVFQIHSLAISYLAISS